MVVDDDDDDDDDVTLQWGYMIVSISGTLSGYPTRVEICVLPMILYDP